MFYAKPDGSSAIGSIIYRWTQYTVNSWWQWINCIKGKFETRSNDVIAPASSPDTIYVAPPAGSSHSHQ